MPHHKDHHEDGPGPEPGAKKEGFHLPGGGKLGELGEQIHTLGEDMKRDLGVIKEDLADIEVRGARTKELIDEIREDIDRTKDE